MMHLCQCPQPTRNLAQPNRLRCDQCDGWTPQGRTPTPATMAVRISETIALLENLARDYQRSDGLAPIVPIEHVPIRTSRRPDPTATEATHKHTWTIGRYRLLAACHTALAREHARLADEAIGMAFLTADPRPPERAAGTWYPQIVNDQAIAEAHQAQHRRHARGEY